MGRIIYILVFVIFYGITRVDARTCYVCHGCKEINSTKVETYPNKTRTVSTSLSTTSSRLPSTTVVKSSTSTSTTSEPSPKTPSSVNATSKPGTEIPPSTTTSDHSINRGRRALLSIVEQLRNDDELDPECIEVIYEDNGITDYIRDCYYRPEEETTDQCGGIVDPTTSSITKCNVCSNDLCNTAGKSTTTIGLYVSCLISVFTIYFHSNVNQ